MSLRTEQLSSEILRISSKVINEEIEFPPGLLVTILGVDVSPDLERALVRVSIFPETMRGSGLEHIRKRGGFIQRKIAKTLLIKSIPRLEFAIADETWLDTEEISIHESAHGT